VQDKRISERMVGGIDQDKYSLPGVAFVCYFTDNWVATHGCYWHNDWGRPRSHGCVNLPSNASRWLWRWTTPYPPLDVMYYRPENRLDGTKIIVRQ
jgi:lipoprotein-anchoring transpeptidase ErfK/SrfK